MSTFITMVIHAESKAGKTTLGSTAPKPILLLDSEAGGFRFVDGKIIDWDPIRQDVPKPGDWDICRVSVKDRHELKAALEVVRSGQHPFVSIVIDSITEYQTRLTQQYQRLDQQSWGDILRELDQLVMGFRDATDAQDQLKAFVVIAGTEFRDGKFRPMLQGQMKKKLSYKLDLTAYLDVVIDENGEERRRLRLSGDPLIEAGSRPKLPPVMWDTTITEILQLIEKEEN